MIDLKDVRRIAQLAQLQLTPAEEEAMCEHLSGLLDYFKVLDSIKTDGVKPMSHSLELHNAFVPDEPAPGLSLTQALANAPDQAEDQVRVPAVIE